jgi:exosome complex RNA-binding protein Rrp4
MFAQRVTVNYVDGSSREVTCTQWSIGQFAQYAQNKGWTIDPSSPGLLAITMLRFQAFAELHRDPTTARPTFDKWDLTVAEVTPVGEAAEVDPTQSVPSGG